MKKYFSDWTIIILILLIIPPVVLSVRYFSDIEFRYNLMAGLLSTLAGIIIGIPIALRLNHIQDQKDLIKKQNEEKDRKQQIITIIRNELLFNKEQLTDRQPNTTNVDRVVNVEVLKDKLWQALSDGGELTYINEPELLDVISKAYYHIRIVKYLEDKYFAAIHFPGLMIQQESPPNVRILNYLKQIDSAVINSIELCIQQLNLALK